MPGGVSRRACLGVAIGTGLGPGLVPRARATLGHPPSTLAAAPPHPVAASLPAASVPVVPRVLSIPAPHPSARVTGAFFPDLLRLALDRTAATDGPVVLRPVEQEMTSARQLAELRQGRSLDVIWDGTDRERETVLRAVPVSLLHELNDYRVCLVRREDLPRFRAVRTLDALRRFQAGAGEHWPSTNVLRANGFTVVTSVSHEPLFPMLRGGRFDFLPRGAWEAWAEVEAHPGLDLAVEDSFFLHYPLPFHFFVRREDEALADRIARGLALARADGSHDRLLASVPAYRRGLAEIRAGRRRVFELKVP